MNLDKFKGKGLFVFSDPAGATAVLAQVYLLKKENQLTDFLIVSDRNYAFFEDFGLEVKPYQESDEFLVFDTFKPDLLFTGTSYTSKIELKFIQEAQKRKVKSCAFIDHWTNFRSRFVWGENLILPDFVWVIDDKAQNLALQDGLPEKKLFIAGNPYCSFLETWKPAINKETFLANLDLPKTASYILYVPEPLSQVGGKEKFGFDEFEVLEKIISGLSEKYLLNLQAYFLIKPHPNHKLEMFEDVVSKNKHSNIQLVNSEVSINTLMFYADLVIGIFSNALIEGKIIGANVVRFLPESCKMDLLEVNQEIKLLKYETLVFYG